MKKETLIIAIAVVIIGTIFIVRGLSPEDTWICDDNQWVAHGNPSSPQPVTGCGVAISSIATNNSFDETGHLMQGTPGLKPDAWYLSYEKPGAPALYKELVFDDMSICVFNGNKGDCPDVLLPSSTMTRVRGALQGDVVMVSDAVSGVSNGI